MNAPHPQGALATTHPAAAPELAEIELALFAQSISDISFEQAVENAMKLVGGEVLFTLPAIEIEDCSRVAAVALGPERRQILLVLLAADDKTMRIEAAAESSHTIADLAASYADLMGRIQPLAS